MKLSERQAMILFDVARQAIREKLAATPSPDAVFGYSVPVAARLLEEVLKQQDDNPTALSEGINAIPGCAKER